MLLLLLLLLLLLFYNNDTTTTTNNNNNYIYNIFIFKISKFKQQIGQQFRWMNQWKINSSQL